MTAQQLKELKGSHLSNQIKLLFNAFVCALCGVVLWQAERLFDYGPFGYLLVACYLYVLAIGLLQARVLWTALDTTYKALEAAKKEAL